jgi:hypothetical protein
MKSIYERIKEGEYENDFPLPPAGADPTAAAKMRGRYRNESARLEEQFYLDLCSFHGVDREHPAVRKMIALAYDKGHSNGFHEVALEFDDLVEVFREFLDSANVPCGAPAGGGA